MAGRLAPDAGEFDPDLEQAIATYVANNPDSPAAKQWRAADAPARPADVGGIRVSRAVPTRAEQIDRAVAEGRDLSPFATPNAPDASPAPKKLVPTPKDEAMYADLRAASRGSPPLPMDELPDRPSPGQVLAPTRAPGVTQQPPEALARAWEAANKPAMGAGGHLSREVPPAPPAAQEPPPVRAGVLPPPDKVLPPPGGPARPPRPRVQVGYAASTPQPNGVEPEAADPGTGAPPSAPAVASAAPPAAPSAPSALDLALERARGNRLVAGLVRAGGTAIGRGTGPGYDALDENADRPLAELAMRQDSDARAKAQASAAAENDPNSPQSQQARALLGELVPGFVKRAEFATMTAAQAKSMFPQAGKLFEGRMDIERIRMQQEGESARERMKRGGAGGPGAGKILPSTEAARVGDLDAAVKMVDQLMATRGQKVGLLSGVTQYIPGTDAAQYTDAADTTAQAVGYILEGGKLSDVDLPRYRRMLPTAGDSEERARAKAENIKRALSAKRSGQLEAFGKAGYRVIDLLEKGGVPTGAPTSAAGAPPSPGMVRIRDPKTGRTGWARPGAVPAGAEVISSA